MTFKATRKIALEEHFAIEETVQDSAGFVPQSYWPSSSIVCSTSISDASTRWIEMPST